jgi:hypothetical protein
VEDASDREPPARIQYQLEEALDLLAALEEARDALITTDHLAEGGRRLGFDEPRGDDG